MSYLEVAKVVQYFASFVIHLWVLNYTLQDSVHYILPNTHLCVDSEIAESAKNNYSSLWSLGKEKK